MKTSGTITALAAALTAAQADIKAVGKDRTNPHFKNKYATLDNIVDTVRPALAVHGIAVLQDAPQPHTDEAGKVTAFTVETMLLHKSGEWISGSVTMPIAQQNPQGVGSALTYGRRYGLSALLSLATDEDDDGNAGSQQPARGHEQRRPPTRSAGASASTPPASPAPTAAAASGEQRDDAGEAVLRELLKDQRLTGEQRATWEKWLAKPRSTDDLQKAMARVEDQITAATAA